MADKNVAQKLRELHDSIVWRVEQAESAVDRWVRPDADQLQRYGRDGCAESATFFTARLGAYRDVLDTFDRIVGKVE